MKKTILILLILTAFISISRAQSSGKIYFFANDYTVNAFIDKKMVCRLKLNWYSVHEVAPGKHQVDVQLRGNDLKEIDTPFFIDVEGGKTYYIKTLVIKKGVVANLRCEETTENSAKTLIKEMKGEDTNCFK